MTTNDEHNHGAQSAESSIPEEVRGAYQAWRLTVGLQVVAALVMLVVNLLDPLVMIPREDLEAAAPQMNPEQLLAVARTLVIIASAILLGICSAFWFFNTRMLKGSSAARVVLSAGSGYLAVVAVMVFFGPSTPAVAAAPTWLQFLDGAVAIASAAAAVAGAVLAASKPAAEYFQRDTPSAGAKSDSAAKSDKSEPAAKPTSPSPTAHIPRKEKDSQ